MEILVFNNQEDASVNTESVKKVVEQILKLEEIQTDEVAVHFVTQTEICHLHELYFQDPSPTDCISFPLDDEKSPYSILGEIFICPKAAIDYTQQKPFLLYREITLYVIHGILHLIGYDDIKMSDRRKMRQAEKRAMAHLIQASCLLIP